jgi:hypothetical protein
MKTNVPDCPACRVRMEPGHVLDHADNGRLMRVSWTEGDPEPGGIHGHRVKGRRQYATVTWRCPRCGWLVWFAPEPEGT